jgi:hypothetical protein
MKRFRYSSMIITLFLCTMGIPLRAQEKKEKSTIRIDLTYHQQNEDLPILRTSAKTKPGKKFEPVEGVDINLFFNEETAQGFIGRVTTNNHGVASLSLPARLKSTWDSLLNLKFIATATDNEHFDDGVVEIEVVKARIDLALEEVDSVRVIRAKVLSFGDSSWVGIPETEIKLVIRRLLSDLSAGEEEFYTTDETGEASTEFNLAIPGDANGNIIIGAKIEDHDLFGNQATTKVIKWGLPLAPDNSFAKRTLWSTRDKTPIWLLIFPNLMIAGVWSTIFYLIYLVIRIIKLGKADKSV